MLSTDVSTAYFTILSPPSCPTTMCALSNTASVPRSYPKKSSTITSSFVEFALPSGSYHTYVSSFPSYKLVSFVPCDTTQRSVFITLYVIGVVAFFDARISNSPTRTHPAVCSLFTIRIALIFSLVVKFTV